MIAAASFGTTSLCTRPRAVWEESLPAALYHGDPVVEVIEAARAAIDQALAGRQAEISEPAYR
jgi:hypothetical protein